MLMLLQQIDLISLFFPLLLFLLLLMGGHTLLSAVELSACQHTWVASAGLQPRCKMSARPGCVQQDGFVSLLRGPSPLQ